MTTPAPDVGPTAIAGNRRFAPWVVLALVLFLVSTFSAFALGNRMSESNAAAVPIPSPSGGSSSSSAPNPTVTVIETPPPALPSTGTGEGDGSTSGGTGSGDGQGPTIGSGTGSVDGSAGSPFRLTAALVGGPILLGEKRTLRVSVTNPNARPLVVTTVSTTVLTPSRAGCQASWLTVGDYSAAAGPAVRVAARGTAVIDVGFELVDLAGTNQNACQGSTFPLSLKGTGQLS